jgi:hypothetical protein
VQGVDRKVRVELEFGKVVFLDKALGLESVVFGLVLDAGEGFHRRFVISGLENAAE